MMRLLVRAMRFGVGSVLKALNIFLGMLCRLYTSARNSKRSPHGGNRIHLDHLREELLNILRELGGKRGGISAI